MPSFTPEPLRVVCDTCGAEAETFDYRHPDRAVVCSCCPLPHDHAGRGCRTVTIHAKARLSLLDVPDLLDAMSGDTTAQPGKVVSRHGVL